MLIPECVAHVAAAAAGKNSRYSLAGVLVQRVDDTTCEAVATDGIRIIAARFEEPACNLSLPKPVAGFQAIVPIAAWREAFERCSRVISPTGLLIDEAPSSGRVSPSQLPPKLTLQPIIIYGPKSEWLDPVTCDALPLKFPMCWREVIPDYHDHRTCDTHADEDDPAACADCAVIARLNPKLLSEMLSAFAAFNYNEDRVSLLMPVKHGIPVVLRAELRDADIELFGSIMPYLDR